MSLAREMTAVGQAATADFEEEDVRNLRTGAVFKAKVQPIADIELNTELGRDPRESVLIHIRDRAVAAAINMNDQLEAIGEKFRAIRRTDNPASFHVEFGCMKVTEQDS